jgi:hypothetical protein
MSDRFNHEFREVFGGAQPGGESRALDLALRDAPAHVREYVAECRSARLEGRTEPEYRPQGVTDKWTKSAISRLAEGL